MTTCRYESHEEPPDGISGSDTVPHLVHLGDLRWIGRDFDFVDVSNAGSLPLLKHSNAQAALARNAA